jgi:hypothetical protein
MDAASSQQNDTSTPVNTVLPHPVTTVTVNDGGCNPSTSIMCGMNYNLLVNPQQQFQTMSLETAMMGYIYFSKSIQHNNPNPPKGARPRKDKKGKIIGWAIPGKGADKGKLIDKSLDWGKANGLDPTDGKWAMGAATAAAAGAGALSVTEILEGVAAGALAF